MIELTADCFLGSDPVFVQLPFDGGEHFGSQVRTDNAAELSIYGTEVRPIVHPFERVCDDEIRAGLHARCFGDLQQVGLAFFDFEFEFDEEAAVVPVFAEFVDEFFGGGGGDGDFLVRGFELGGGDVLDGPGFGGPSPSIAMDGAVETKLPAAEGGVAGAL